MSERENSIRIEIIVEEVYTKAGILKEVSYSDKEGMLHRYDGGPALIEYDKTGKIIIAEWWYQNDKLYRDGDLPTCKEYSEDGKTVIFEMWSKGYEKHRPLENGPALIRRDKTGAVIQREYYLEGIKQPDPVIFYEEEKDIRSIIMELKKHTKEDLEKCIAFLGIINAK